MKRLPLAICCLLLLSVSSRAEEKFVSIYNGSDLSGWVVEGTDKFKDKDGQAAPVWSVTDGLIHCAGKGFGFLRYDKKEFADFALRLEFRMTKKCNSGVGIRTVKFTGPAETRPSFAGYEIQLLDDAGTKPDEHSSYSLYRYVPATSNPSKPFGEWNTLEVRCVGPRIQVTANGVLCQNTDQTTVNAIKDKALSGYVCVQNHGGVVDFRNIEILDLGGTIVERKAVAQPDADVAAEKKSADKQAANAKKAADKKAAEKKAADQKAADQKAADQKAADQKAADQKAADQKAADKKAADEKQAAEKAAAK